MGWMAFTKSLTLLNNGINWLILNVDIFGVVKNVLFVGYKL